MQSINIRVIVVVLAFTVSAYILGLLTFPLLQKSINPVALENLSENTTLTLPSDAVKISGCVPFEGEHWVSPKDIKHGPYYIMEKGKVLGIEFMFSPEDISGEKYTKMGPEQFVAHMQQNNLEFKDVVNDIRSFNFDTLGINVKYFDLHWTPPHAGSVHPHYDMHMYIVDKSEMDLVCPDSTMEEAFATDLYPELIKSNIPVPQAP
jgi:hypothetical protein